MNLNFPSMRVITETGFKISSDHIFPSQVITFSQLGKCFLILDNSKLDSEYNDKLFSVEPTSPGSQLPRYETTS